jgi:hypothetical protein
LRAQFLLVLDVDYLTQVPCLYCLMGSSFILHRGACHSSWRFGRKNVPANGPSVALSRVAYDNTFALGGVLAVTDGLVVGPQLPAI